MSAHAEIGGAGAALLAVAGFMLAEKSGEEGGDWFLRVSGIGCFILSAVLAFVA